MVRRAVPTPEERDNPFWAGARNHRLVIQRCGACGHYEHPPTPECSSCHALDITFVQVSGTGRIHARSIVESPVLPGFEDALPLACLAVELDEQPGLLVSGNLVGAPAYTARVGTPVRVTYSEQSGVIFPLFALQEAGSNDG